MLTDTSLDLIWCISLCVHICMYVCIFPFIMLPCLMPSHLSDGQDVATRDTFGVLSNADSWSRFAPLAFGPGDSYSPSPTPNSV